MAIRLDTDANLRFDMLHERIEARGNSLSPGELKRLRAQEQRWCRDLQGLVAHLIEDGFDSRISFEHRCRSVECTSVPGVVVERFTRDTEGARANGDAETDAYEDANRRLRSGFTE